MTENTGIPTNRAPRDVASPFEPASSNAFGNASRWLLVIVVVGVAAGAAWWFTRSPNAAANAAAGGGGSVAPATDSLGNPVMLAAEGAGRIGVTYAVVERGSLTPDVRTVGLVTFDETRVKTIAPKIDGWVEQLYVASTGQAVAQHDPVLRIYSPMLVTAQEELLLAKRLATDVGNGNADAARNAESLLAAARRRLQYWDIPDEDVARVEQTGEVQKTLTLRSPLSGVVVQKNVQSGQRIMAGDAVYQVADLREVWLEGEVFERDLAVMRIGQSVSAEFTAIPGAQREGRIVYIAPTVAPETRTVKVRVALANPGLDLKPGMYATIHLRGTTRTNLLHVPRSAVLVTGTRTLVFIKGADGTLTPRAVELGGSTDDRVEILRGVTVGETVVSSATFLVDAESNLGSALGAMAGMPGMDVAAPKSTAPATGAPAAGTPAKSAPAKTADPMADMPGMGGGKASPTPPAKTPPKKP